MYPRTASGQVAKTTPITAGRLAKFAWTLHQQPECPVSAVLSHLIWSTRRLWLFAVSLDLVQDVRCLI
jgi:hypothetical protein